MSAPAADATTPVDAARRIAAEIRKHSEEIEAARRLPERWVRELRRAGLFRLCVPRSCDGPELHPEALVRVCEELAAGDASAAWCAMIASTSGVLAGYLDADTAKEVFGSPEAIAGGVFAPAGRAERRDGAFRVNGRWSFASGCEHATWLLGGCVVQGAAGPELLPSGRPDVRLLLFPAERAQILDTWHVSGLCGTGSHDIAVRELVVPERFGVSLVADRPREPGALYAFPVFGLLALGIAGVALGIARRALLELRELAAAKSPAFSARKLAERPTVQARVAEAEGQRAAARALLLEAVEETFERAAAGVVIGAEERARLRLAATWAARSCAQVVDCAYELGGGSSLYRSSALQRLFRDAHALTQHAMVAPGSLELVGRVWLGLETDVAML